MKKKITLFLLFSSFCGFSQEKKFWDYIGFRGVSFGLGATNLAGNNMMGTAHKPGRSGYLKIGFLSIENFTLGIQATTSYMEVKTESFMEIFIVREISQRVITFRTLSNLTKVIRL
ncbi:hypothetical protein AB4865_01450 [Capnocytophaga sp. ARDL2]|uniref:hypothetical protein n=1 Tax=Capnocytophaga sp. ARDL2 TaxID=3238809 RepID=UPI0035581506